MSASRKSRRSPVLWILAGAACLGGLVYLATTRSRGPSPDASDGPAPPPTPDAELREVSTPGAVGGEEAEPPAPSAGGRWTLRGRTTWQTASTPIAHRPVAGALVRLSPAPPWPGTPARAGGGQSFPALETRSGADGSFAVEGAPAGVELLLEAEDAAAGCFAIRCVLPDPEGDAVRDAGDLGLERGHGVRVVVEDEAQRPVRGARVWLTHRSTLPRGLASLEVAGQPRLFEATGPGDHVLGRVPGRRHLLRVEAQGYAPHRVEIHPAEATTVRVALSAVRSLRGTVLAVDGEPIAGAAVRAGEGTEAARETVTDEEGRFALEGVAGAAAIRASAGGFCDEAQSFEAADDDVELRLVPEAVVAGRVVQASDETPLAGARVHLGAGPLAPGTAQAAADASGAFRLGGLRAGAHVLRAEHEGFLPQLSEPVFLEAGAVVADVTLRLTPALPLRGRVVDDASGGGVAGAEIAIVQAKSGSRPTIERRLEARADGAFTAGGLASGRAVITVRSPERAWARLEVELAAPQEDEVVVRLEPGFELTGRVLGPDGEPVSGAAVEVENEALVAGKRSDATDADGSFRIPGLSAGGRHELRVWHTDFLPEVERLDMTAGDPPQLVEVHLRRGARLRVQSRDAEGRAVPRATVLLTGAAWRGEYESPFLEGVTDATGAASLGPLEPQPTWLAATAPGRAPALPRPIAVAEGETTEVEIVFPAGATLRGRVLDDAGQPIEGAEVTVSLPWEAASALSAADGSFAIASLPLEPCFVRARKAGFVAAYARTSPGPSAVELRLERPARIRCRVSAAPGAAGAGPRVALHSPAGDCPEVELDAAGRFDALVPSGPLAIHASARGCGTATLRLELRPGELREAELALEPEGRIEGEIVERETGEPLARCDLLLVGRAADGGSLHAREATFHQGTLAFDELPAGLYTLRPASGDPLWTGRVEGLRVAAGSTTRVRLELERSRGIRGRVTRAGEGAEGVRVVARAVDGGSEHAATSEAGGHYELAGLEHGAYEVTAAAGGRSTAPRRIEVARDIEPIDFALETVKVHGRIAAGGSLDDSSLRLEWLSPGSLQPETICDISQAGAYEVWLPAGATYELRVWRGGLALRTFLELPAAASERRLDLALPPPAGK